MKVYLEKKKRLKTGGERGKGRIKRAKMRFRTKPGMTGKSPECQGENQKKAGSLPVLLKNLLFFYLYYG
jgi:hypothetical protein